jgi:outer membrane protein TolC
LVLSLLGISTEPILSQEISDPAVFIQTVLSRHPSIQKADELVRSAEFGLKASGLQPNPTLTMAATVGDPGEDSNALTQNFEISGQPSLRRSIASRNLEASQRLRDSVRREVVALAYGNWLELWKAQRLFELAQLRKILLDEMTRVAKRRFEVGEIAENEALRVELAAAQAETNLISAQAQCDGARRSAALLLGMDPVNLEPNPSDPISLLSDTSLETVLDSALEHPEIQSQFLRLGALELGSELIEKERAPTLGFSLYRSSLIRTDSVQQGAQLSLSWPIFDWGSITNRAQQQRAQASAFRAGIEETVLDIRRQLSKIWTRLQAAKQIRSVLTQQAERYEELAREARVAYDVGLWSLTDVLQTEQTYRQARVELLEATAEVVILELQILERTGLSFPPDLLKEDL